MTCVHILTYKRSVFFSIQSKITKCEQTLNKRKKNVRDATESQDLVAQMEDRSTLLWNICRIEQFRRLILAHTRRRFTQHISKQVPLNY